MDSITDKPSILETSLIGPAVKELDFGYQNMGTW